MKKKLYKCEKCGREVPVRSKGLCPSCRAKEKGMGKRKPISASNKNPGISRFFISMIERLSETGMSYTGKPIHYPSACNVCHILPKRKYTSVAMDEDNIIFLTEDEHRRFDFLLDSLEFEKLEKEYGTVWKRAVDKILKMEHEGKVKERGNLIISLINNYDTE